MFERLCALLLRIYPAGFRRAYGREAVQLMHDRARHERGVFLRARLLTDLAIDLFATWRHGWQPGPATAARIDGAPRFDIIEVHGPRPEALAAGMLTSMLMFASFTLLFQPQTYPPRPVQAGEGSGIETPGADTDDSAQLIVVPDSDRNHELLAAIAANLRQFYFDRAVGQQLADALLAHDKKREYEPLDFFPDLVARINKDIQAASRALGVARGAFVADVVYSARPLPAGPLPMMTAETRERNRARILEQNCLFETIETLPNNVGYLKLNGFADATACRELTERAMASLNNAAALIIDLRDNGGGFGETALQIAGYLFDRPTFMYDPRPRSPVPDRTASPIPGNKLADKPVYILTSSRTQSAAEYFAYNLQMLKRATLVGETTAGRQHSGAFRRITDHFGMGIQEVAPPDNPYPVKGWDVIGVEPDVKVSSAEALAAAKELATDSTPIRP
jgi:Peptidase family S41